LAFATNRLQAIFAKVINLNLVLLTEFLLHFLVDQLVHDCDQIIDKSVATGHAGYTFDLLAAMWTLWLVEQAPSDAAFAIEFRAVGAHHRIIGMAKTYVAGQ